jgi:FRG domain
MFLRGQQCLYLLQRDGRLRKMLFAGSCDKEPAYDVVHFGLKAFLEEEVLRRDDAGENGLWEEWRNASIDLGCRLDSAILALAQHYGVPSHGLDVTTSDDVALWFATNRSRRDMTGAATYTPLSAEDRPSDRERWPVVLACQNVTLSIQQSLHDCQVLAPFGFDARRPAAQKARFFLGGHSDHQNRVAEAVVCVFRLAPGNYAMLIVSESQNTTSAPRKSGRSLRQELPETNAASRPPKPAHSAQFSKMPC